MDEEVRLCHRTMIEKVFRVRVLLEHLPAWKSVSWWDDKGKMHSRHEPEVFQLSLNLWRNAILKLVLEVEEELRSELS